MIRRRAEGMFRKNEEQPREGAMAEYEAASRAVLETTQRLRALRLAKEAAEREAGRAPGAPQRSRRRKPAVFAK
jgi:hypothetical protein